MNKRYVCSDFHGVYAAWEAVQNHLDNTDTLYFLGDAADRGPDGWAIITELLNDSRVIYLKGNHEDMLAKAMLHWPGAANDCFHNGGEVTYIDWMQETNSDKSFAYKLLELPEFKIVDNKFILSHAGCGSNFKEIEPDWIWGRAHLTEPWDESIDMIVVHGHTQVPLMPQFNRQEDNLSPQAFRYANGHKINIDLGGVWTGYFCLLDLDTLDEEIIKI